MTGRWLSGRRLLDRCLPRRWGRGDTGLGAAVTGLPTGPLRWAPAAPEPVAPEPVAPEPASPEFVAPEPAAPAPVRVGPQVVLGFRDGSEAVLDPESAQARALEGIARTLAARD